MPDVDLGVARFDHRSRRRWPNADDLDSGPLVKGSYAPSVRIAVPAARIAATTCVAAFAEVMTNGAASAIAAVLDCFRNRRRETRRGAVNWR